MLPELTKRTKKVSSAEITALATKYIETQNELILEELIYAYKPFLINQLKRSNLGNSKDFDDAFQMGLIGVLKALQAFNPAKGYHFTTFAFYSVKHELNEYKQSKSLIELPRDIYLDNYKGSNKEEIQKLGTLADLEHKTEDNMSLKERLADIRINNTLEELASKDEFEYIKQLAKKILKDKELKVFLLKYFSETKMSNLEVSKNLCIPYSSINDIDNRTLIKIKRHLIAERKSK